MLNISNPALGEEWWKKILALKWGNDSYATLEKLNLLALADVPIATKNMWLALLEANKTTKALFGLPRGDYDFRGYVYASLAMFM